MQYPVEIRPHHQRTIDRLVETFKGNPNYLALIIGGSVVKGRAQESSDVDFTLVATDEEYARCQAANNYTYFSTDLTDYEGGYVDGKVIDMGFLADVVARGTEPARSAFINAVVVWCTEPRVADLVRQAPLYPESERREKIHSFMAQMEGLRWFMGEADKRRNLYLAHHVGSEMALYGVRMILAHNRIIYPYHKWMMTDLERCPEKPEGIVRLVEELVVHPSAETAEAFYGAVMGLTDWGVLPEGWVNRWLQETEWNWRTGLSPIADR